MNSKKITIIFVFTLFVFSIFANTIPAFSADSSIGDVNKSVTSGSNISENKQSDNAGGAVSSNGVAQDKKVDQKIAKFQTLVAVDTSEAKLCRTRMNRLAFAALTYAKMAQTNKKLFPRSAKELVNANHISKDEIYCVHKDKGLLGEKKHEYSFKLQQPYEKFIVIECGVHPENRVVVPMPHNMSKKEIAEESKEKKECMIKMITAAGAVSRAVRVAVHDKKMLPRDIGVLIDMNHLSKNEVCCPHEIKKLFGTKNEVFSLQLQSDEKSYKFECPYHGNFISIKVPEYKDTLNINEKEELAKEKEREEKLKQAVKDGLILAAAAPLIPVALTVAGGVWAANTAYEAGKKAGAFLAEKGKQAGEAVVKAGEAAAKTAQEAARAASETAKKAGEAVVNTGKNAAEAVKKAGEAVADTGKRAAEAVVETGKKVVEETGKALTNAGVAVADTSINFLEGAQSFINGGLNNLKNGLSNWRNGLKK